MTHTLIDAHLWTIAGWTMFHSVWIGIAIGAIAWIVRRGVQSATANVRYAIALGCFAILAISPLPIAAYVYQTHPRANSAVAEFPVSMEPKQPVVSPQLVTGGGSFDTTNNDEPAIVVDAGSPQPDAAFSTRADNNSGSIVAGVPAVEIDDPPRFVEQLLNVVVAWFPWVWLMGAPTTLLFLATGFLGAERLRRQSQPIDNVKILQLLHGLAASLHVRTEVAIGICDRFAGPILVGIVRPMILLPPAALLHWSPDQLEMVLLHELSHIRRRDNLVNLLQRLVEALMFFVPSVWFVSAWVRLEREHCCDRCVVKNTGKAREYAETLVELAERRRSVRATNESLSKLLISPMAEHQVLTRVRQILKHEDESMKISRMLFGSMLTMFVTTAVLAGWYGATLRAGQEQVEPSPVGHEVNDGPAESEKTTTNASSATEDEKTPAKASGPTIQPVEGFTKLGAPPAEWLAKWQAANVQRRLLAAARSNGVQPKEYWFTLRFLDDVKLSSPRAGVLERIKVQQGDAVKAGDELAGFDSNEADQAKVDLRIAQIKLEGAMQEHKRAAALQAGGITKGELDQRALDMKVAELEVQRQELKLASLIKPFSAPISGVVAEVLKQPGEGVTAGTPILRIVNVDRFAVEGMIDIARTPVPKRGDAFRFILQIGSQGNAENADKRQIFKGKFDFVSSQLIGLDVVPRESDTALRVRGVIDNRDGILRAGMKGIFELVDGTGKAIKPQQESGQADRDAAVIGWVPNMFGANLVNRLSRDDAASAKLFEGTPYRGGLVFDCLDPKGPAAKAGIRDGDILVGLGKWETSDFADVVYVLTDAPKVDPQEPLKF